MPPSQSTNETLKNPRTSTSYWHKRMGNFPIHRHDLFQIKKAVANLPGRQRVDVLFGDVLLQIARRRELDEAPIPTTDWLLFCHRRATRF